MNEINEPPIMWIAGDKPTTPKGSSTLMWVTMRHKKSGKCYVGIMTYLNGHVMRCSDQCEPPDCAVPHNPDEDGDFEEYEWTCWTNGACDHCETEWVWHDHYSEIIAHAIATKPEPYQAYSTSSLDRWPTVEEVRVNYLREGYPLAHALVEGFSDYHPTVAAFYIGGNVHEHLVGACFYDGGGGFVRDFTQQSGIHLTWLMIPSNVKVHTPLPATESDETEVKP